MDVIMKGILDSYPIVFVDDTYTIRSMNRYAEYHYYQERGYGPLLGKRIYIQPVRDGKGKLIGFFERFELNQEVRR